MKKILITITMMVIAMVAPTTVVKAADTEYIDIFIPTGIQNVYVQGERKCYNPDPDNVDIEVKDTQSAEDNDYPDSHMAFKVDGIQYESWSELEDSDACKYTIEYSTYKVLTSITEDHPYYKYYTEWYKHPIREIITKYRDQSHKCWDSYYDWYMAYKTGKTKSEKLNYWKVSIGETDYKTMYAISEPYTGTKKYKYDPYEVFFKVEKEEKEDSVDMEEEAVHTTDIPQVTTEAPQNNETTNNTENKVINKESDQNVKSEAQTTKNKNKKRGWYKKNGKKYYYNKNGKMVKGLKKINGKYYYFNKKGQMITKKWKTVKGKKYYFGKSGKATKIKKIKK